MFTVVREDPAELLAQTVNTASAMIWLGVPQIVPLLVSKVRPVGKVALMAHEVTAPLVAVEVSVGVMGVIVDPVDAVRSTYAMGPGAPVTCRVRVPCVVVPNVVTVTVCVVFAWTSVGVPEIVPVFQLSTSPDGRFGVIVKTGLGVKPLPVPCTVVRRRS